MIPHFGYAELKYVPAFSAGIFTFKQSLTTNQEIIAIALDHRNIAGIVKRSRKLLNPLVHLPLTEMRHAQSFGAAPQFAAVLGGDNDAVGHYSYPDRHPRRKTRLEIHAPEAEDSHTARGHKTQCGCPPRSGVVMQNQNPVRQVCTRATYRRQRASPARTRPTRARLRNRHGYQKGRRGCYDAQVVAL